MSSKIEFSRWVSRNNNSLAYSTYVAYGSELRRMYRALLSAQKYVYSTLKTSGASWTDKATSHFDFCLSTKKTNAYFTDLRSWSDSFNELVNWNNLNALVTINANFETYMVKIFKLALESDVGVLYGMSHEMDGIKAIKQGKIFDFSTEVTNCTKGDWTSRVTYIKRYFGNVPSVIENNIAKLEEIRKLRNNIAHSFGRKIESAQEIHDLTRLPIKKLSSEKLLEYWKLIDDCVRQLDEQLLQNHIGDYQFLFLYHTMAADIEAELHSNMRTIGNKARCFRKKYGNLDKNGINVMGSKFCKGLVTYYESI